MTGINDRSDTDRQLLDLANRVRILETASPFANATISHGALRVLMAAGLVFEDEGTLKAGALKIGPEDGGSLKAGTSIVDSSGLKAGTSILDSTGLKAPSATVTGHVQGNSLGAGGLTVDTSGKIGHSSGAIELKNSVTGAAGITAKGTLRGELGVEAPIDGVMTSLGPAVKEADRKGQSAYDNAVAARGEASTAQTRANLGVSKADTAQSRADAAYAMADAAALASWVAAIQSSMHQRVSALETAAGKNPPPMIPNPKG